MMLETTDQIWHISDTASDPLWLPWGDLGAHIVITSPARKRKDERKYKEYYTEMLYLPMPTLSEMEMYQKCIVC